MPVKSRENPVMRYVVAAALSLLAAIAVWQLQVAGAAFARMDDRLDADGERLARIEEAIRGIDQMRGDIRAIRLRVDEQAASRRTK